MPVKNFLTYNSFIRLHGSKHFTDTHFIILVSSCCACAQRSMVIMIKYVLTYSYDLRFSVMLYMRMACFLI